MAQYIVLTYLFCFCYCAILQLGESGMTANIQHTNSDTADPAGQHNTGAPPTLRKFKLLAKDTHKQQISSAVTSSIVSDV